MLGFWIKYVVLPICALLSVILLILFVWLLCRNKKKVEKPSKKKRRNELPAFIKPPEFELPVSFRAIDAQTPAVYVKPSSEDGERSRKSDESEGSQKSRGRKKGMTHAISEPNRLAKINGEDDEFGAFKTSVEFSRRRRAFGLTNDETSCYSAPERNGSHLSLPSLDEIDTISSAGSFTIDSVDREPVRNTSSKGRQRRISVTVFEHLKAEGKKISQTKPYLGGNEQSEALTAAIAAAESQYLLPEKEAGQDQRYLRDDKQETEMPGDHGRRRIAARRGQERLRFTKAGKVCFSILYDKEKHILEVTILRAFDLGKRKEHNYVNPFVRLYLLPGKKQKQHTRVQRRTKEPYFNDRRLFYDLSEIELISHRLKLKVYSREAVKKNELLGEVDIALSSINVDEKETYSLDLHLKNDEPSAQIMISLLHDAASSKLKIIIHKAKQIPKLSSIGLPDTYCRILFCRENDWEKKETRIKRNSKNPSWDETHVIAVATNSSNPLNTMSLVVTVVNHSLMGKDEIIGHVIFSLDSTQNSAVQQWKEVEASPHTLITKWHTLLEPEDL